MKINRQQFINALTKVKPGLANNEIIEQSTHFIFDNNIIRTFNDEIAITHKFETGLVGSVSAKEFYTLFTKIPDEEITAEIKDGKFIFKGKGKRVTFNIEEDVTLTNIQPAGPRAKLWMDLPENFCDCVRYCGFSTSRNMTRPELTCVSICGKQAISCDAVRATQIEMDCEIEKDFLLPGVAAEIINNYNPHRFYMDANWIHFINKENTTFSCRQVSEEYPVEAIKGVFDVKGKKVSLPEELKEILERSKVLVSGEMDSKEVVIAFKKGKIICQATGAVGQITEQVDTGYKDKDLKIIIHPELLMEIMKRVSEATIGDDKILFKDKEGFEHVIILYPDDENIEVKEIEEDKPKAKKTTKKRRRG